MIRVLLVSTIFIYGITSTKKAYACGEKKGAVKAEAQVVLPIAGTEQEPLLAIREVRSKSSETKPVEKSSEAEK